ncbi:MAG: SCO family protein [Acidobacteria bacterium]|nr:MAG: SCO family protein [Acidobacteriota bacterium]
MEKFTRRSLLVASAATPIMTGLAGTGSGTPEDGAKPHPPYHFENISPRELIRRRHLPNVELITHEGKHVHFYDDLVKDRRVVLQFMFTQCDKICPLTTDHLVKVQKLLNDRVGHDIFFYSITLSPEEDSPAALKAYAKQHGANWTFLTGKPEDILFLRRSLGFTYNNPKEDADRNNHSGMLLIADEPLMRWAHAEGGARPEWIASIIRNEADSPFKGTVNGAKLSDPAVHVK